jgi:hypothetical protein
VGMNFSPFCDCFVLKNLYETTMCSDQAVPDSRGVKPKGREKVMTHLLGDEQS